MTPRSLADTGYRSTAESELTKYIRKRALGELIEYTGETTVNVSKMTRIRFAEGGNRSRYLLASSVYMHIRNVSSRSKEI